MGLISKLDHHTNLFHHMAERREVDLAEAVMDGRMNAQDLRSSVFRCMQCEEAGQCEEWLDDAETDLSTAPKGCRNKAMFERLNQ